jgi:pimeloyl-ACP methyl ester carboxylesterase
MTLRDQASQVEGKSRFEYHRDLVTAQWRQYVCPLMPQSAAAAQLGAPMTSPVPVLAMNGDADPPDPPPNVDGARQRCPNSLQVSVPGQAHDINWASWKSCTGALIGAFVAGGTVANLDTSCVASAHGQPFASTLGAIAPRH